MGRRKIQIAPLADERNRSVTFAKRKAGLFKKAWELGVLCSAEIAIVVYAQNGKLYEFTSSGHITETLQKHTQYGPAHETKGPADFLNAGTSKDDEEEDDFSAGLPARIPPKAPTLTASPDSFASEHNEAKSFGNSPPSQPSQSMDMSFNGPTSQNAGPSSYSQPASSRFPMLPPAYSQTDQMPKVSSAPTPFAHLQATLAIQQQNALLINNLAASQSLLAQHQAGGLLPQIMPSMIPQYRQALQHANSEKQRSGSATMAEIGLAPDEYRTMLQAAQAANPMLRSLSHDFNRAQFDLRATCSDATATLNALAQGAHSSSFADFFPTMASRADDYQHLYENATGTSYSQNSPRHYSDDGLGGSEEFYQNISNSSKRPLDQNLPDDYKRRRLSTEQDDY